MENWGLITYRETNLLYDEKESSSYNKQRVASVIAHELVHQVRNVEEHKEVTEGKTHDTDLATARKSNYNNHCLTSNDGAVPELLRLCSALLAVYKAQVM